MRTLKNLKNDIIEIEKQGIDISKVKILLGDDEELNGVHYAFYKATLMEEDEYKYFDHYLDEDFEKHKWFVIS